MKNWISKLLFVVYLFHCQWLYATDITSSETDAIIISGDNQTINITSSGNLTVDTDIGSAAAISNSAYSNTIININTDSESDGISTTSTEDRGAISFSASSSFSSLTVSSGTITSNSATYGTTVYLGSNTATGSVSTITVGQDSGNTGTISNTSDSGIAIGSGSFASYNLDLTIDVKTTGTVSTTDTMANSVISLSNLSDSAGGSSLTLNNAGTITAGRSDGFALLLVGFDTSVTNSGTILGSIKDSTTFGASSHELKVTNNASGTITGDIILGSNAASYLTLNGGSITGDVTLNNASQTVNLNGGTITGAIDGAGSVSVTKNTVNNGNIGSDTTITSLSLSDGKTFNTTNGSITATNFSLGSGSTLNSGSGNVTASGDFTVGGPVSITAGALTINSGSNLALTIPNNLSTIISLTGAATLASNVTLNATITTGVASGTSITLLDASSSSTINQITDSNININGSGDNAYGVNVFSTLVSGDKLLLVASAPTAPTLSDSKNQSAYNSIFSAATATGNLNSVQTYLSSSSNSNSQKEEVIKSTTNQVDNSTNRLTFNNIATTSQIISARLESVRTDNFVTSITDMSFANDLFNQSSTSPLAALNPLHDNNIKSSYPLFLTLKGDDAISKSSVWVQTFGSKTAQKNTSDGDGYNANSGGVVIGMDRKISKNFILGLNSGYSKSNIKATNSNKSTSIESYQAGIYTGYDAKSYFFNTSLGFSINNYNSDRYISLVNANAKANYSGASYTARTEVGSNYHFPHDVLFTPSFAVTAARNTINTYDEDGAGTLNLHVKTDSTNFFEGRIGGELSTLITTKKGTQMRPLFFTSYGYDFAKNKQKSTSNFIGQTSSFASTGSKIAQGSLKIGSGISFYTKEDVTFSLNYAFEHRSDYASHSGWARMGWNF